MIRCVTILICFCIWINLQGQSIEAAGNLRQNVQLDDSALIARMRSAFSSKFESLSFDTVGYSFKWPDVSFPKLGLKKPLQIHGGNITYSYDYRPNIDTPFTDKNISQHNITGQMSITAFNALPLNVSFFIRRTNSSLFTDINDIRIDFNATQYAQIIKNSYLKQLNAQIPDIKDSMMKRLKNFMQLELSRTIGKFSKPDFQQKLVECNEILRIPAIAESIAGPAMADSVRKKAKEFMDLYADLKSKEALYRGKIDSLQNMITQAIGKANAMRGSLNSLTSPGEIISRLKAYGIQTPRAVEKLLSIRRFSLGRTPLNYSELTARNISLNGINIEYNSWYYFALAAGMVDYRFRDFIVNRADRKPQYMYLVRAGIGRVERNYVIVSAYKGQKQYYYQTSNIANGRRSKEIYGISVEAKYQLNKHNYIIAEIAESANPAADEFEIPKSPGLFNWKNKSNKAYSVKVYSYLPKAGTRIEARYRYAGAAFQSFNRFQVNSKQQSWYIKAEQSFWKRQLRIIGSLRSNEFSNPYIVQQYSSNIVFKMLQVSFRKRKWPVVSAGYMPSSQLTRIDDQLIENHFHTLNIVAYHDYKIGPQRVSSTAMFNQFYNTASDTGFLYFNAVSLYFQHHLFFKRFTASLAASHSRNTGFELNVLEESLQFNFLKYGSMGAGIKINNYNRNETKIGSWFRIGWRFMNNGSLHAQFDDGMIPGKTTLVRNQQCILSVTKTF